jgi:LacI family transcriptional regulator
MTMSEVARACRLSKSAVSMALNNHPQIPEKTRRRVQAVAARLGFKVDPKVAQVMSALGRHNTKDVSAPIGILSMWPKKNAWLDAVSLGRFHRGLVERAAQLGCRTEDFWLGDPEMNPRRMEKILEARGIEAVVVLNYPDAPARLSIDLSNLACSVIGRALVSPRVNAVDADHHQGMFLALETVRARGFSRPALVITEDSNERTMHCWVAAYQFDSSQRPLSRRIPFWIINQDTTRREFLRWFEKYRPDVILGSDMTLPFLQDSGLKIPERTAYAALYWHSDSPLYDGVDIRDEVIAARAIEIVLQQLRENRLGLPDDPETVLIDGKWRDGQSLVRHSR